MENEQIQKKILGLLQKIGFEERDIVITHDEALNTIWFSVTSPGTRLLLARDAEALTALNHIVARMTENFAKENVDRPRIVIDANDFEKKKIEGLKTIAHMMAERARYFKASVDVDPMPPHERRVVHEFLSKMTDVSTESVGDGPRRHIVIKYIGGI